jgi:hypothetical protein
MREQATSVSHNTRTLGPVGKKRARKDHLREENAILAGQQKRQGLLLHLGGNDIANLLSPETKFLFFQSRNETTPEFLGVAFASADE